MSSTEGSGRLLTITTISVLICLIFVGLYRSDQQAEQKVSSVTADGRFIRADPITRKLRSAKENIFRVSVSGPADREKAREYGSIVDDRGTYFLVSSSKRVPSSLSGLDAQKLEMSINLPGASFDPIIEPPAGSVPPGASSAPDGEGYYIVQFGVIARDELLESLKATGVEILQYVPNQAFFVYGNGESIAKAASHSRVRWVGRYLPGQRISKVLSTQLAAFAAGSKLKNGISPIERTGKRTAIFDVSVFKRADIKAAEERIVAATGGKAVKVVTLPNNFFNLVRIESPIDQISLASNVPEVISIESWSRPQKEDEVAAQIVAGNYVGNVIDPPGYNPLSQFGVNGQGVSVSVVDDGVGIPGDGGFYITSGNTVNGPLRGATAGAQGHGHLNSTIIAGDSPFSVLDTNGYNYGLGVAPKANIINIPFLRAGYTGSEADTANDTVSTAGQNGVLGFISNNSWGFGTNGNVYDLYAAQFDGFVRDASSAAAIDPLLLIFSAGNSGASGLTRPKVAKNVISVAATENVRPTLNSAGGSTGAADNLEQLPDFSSRGPAADTRIKPDIAAPGDAVTGGRSGTDALFGNIDSFHRISSGTSHAAPQVAGAAALFTQFWKNGHSGINPSPALVKASIINGAVEVTGTGAASSRPNGSEGWGRIDLKNVLNTGTAVSYFDQSEILTDVGVSRLYSGSVSDPGSPVRVTLVWTDPPGVTDPSLVNDLDLSVTVGGLTYKGNVLSSGSSMTGGSFDRRNNVENVFLPAGMSGPLDITVRAAAINGDGVLGNSDLTDQNYALVVYNGNVDVDTSAFLSVGSPVVLSGNGLVEPNECDLVNIPLTNFGLSTATAVSATLTTTTPGVTITAPNANYLDLSPGETDVNSTAFSLSIDNTVACFTNIDLALTVSLSGGASPLVYDLSIPVGQAGGTNYIFSTSSSASISPSGNFVTGSDADDAAVTFVSPFAFSVYGTNVSAGSNIRLSTNGNLRIETAGSANTGVNNAALPSSDNSFPASLPVLMPYWDDLDMSPGVTSGGGIFSEVTGSPGTRTLKLEWRARHWIANPDLGAPDTNFAVYFHEGSNQFEYVYALTGAGVNSSGGSATVGIQSATTGTTFTQFSLNSPVLSPGLMLNAAIPESICTAGNGGCVRTAAPVSVSGRVVTAAGRGIRGALVTISDAGGTSRTAVTNTFGYFRIEGVNAGREYVITTRSKGRDLPAVILQVNDEISDITIVSEN